jgi:hypothetical protein
MVVVVGDIPDEIGVSKKRFIELLARLDKAKHGTCPHEAELASEIMGLTKSWAQQQSVHRKPEPAEFTQLELPLDWDRPSATG